MNMMVPHQNGKIHHIYPLNKQLMDLRKPFNVQDVVNYVTVHHPDFEIDMNRIYRRLFLLAIVGHVYVLGERYNQLPFIENKTYIPERFIKYIATLTEGNGLQYMTTGNMYNQIDQDIDEGLLFVMRLLTKPNTKKSMLAIMNENLTVERTRKDGTTFIVPNDEYLEKSLQHIENLGFFRS